MDVTRSQLKQLLDIYRRAFVRKESRPIRDVGRMIQNGQYDTHVVVGDGDVCGFMVLLQLGNGITLLDYLAVHHDMRGRGIGSILLKHLPDETVLLEVERVDGDDIERKSARVKFYKKHGATILTDSYVMPGYGKRKVMNLMCMGKPPNLSTRELIELLHNKVYAYRAPN